MKMTRFPQLSFHSSWTSWARALMKRLGDFVFIEFPLGTALLVYDPEGRIPDGWILDTVLTAAAGWLPGSDYFYVRKDR